MSTPYRHEHRLTNVIVRANLLVIRGLRREQHSDYSFCEKEISFSGFFFCEREIIVNACYVLICLGNGTKPNPSAKIRINIENAREIKEKDYLCGVIAKMAEQYGRKRQRHTKDATYLRRVIDKAIEAANAKGMKIDDHFNHAVDMVKLGSGSFRKVETFHLSRMACMIIAENADPRKALV